VLDSFLVLAGTERSFAFASSVHGGVRLGRRMDVRKSRPSHFRMMYRFADWKLRSLFEPRNNRKLLVRKAAVESSRCLPNPR
jgi:hypothetical protein